MGGPIRVEILGNEYLLRSDAPDELCQKIARYVKAKFNQVASTAKGLPEVKIAVLVAFNIAEEYFKGMEEKEQILLRLDSKVRQINQHLEKAVLEGQ